MRLLKLFALLATLATVTAAAAQADAAGQPWGPETPNFNLEVLLRPAAGGPAGGFGLVKFRQPNDASKIIYLDVWVRGLDSSHDYYLQRATDMNLLDESCTGTNWVKLGQGPTEQKITTNDGGTARAALYRELSSVAIGTRFDIYFQVIDAGTSDVVLESPCYRFTLSQ